MLWKVVCTGERVVQVEAVATAAGEDAVDGLLRADALRTPELDVDVLERDPLDVRAMQPAQRAERRREGVRGVDAEPGQIGCDPRGAAGGVRDHGVESLEPERTRTGRDRVSAVPCGRRTGIAARGARHLSPCADSSRSTATATAVSQRSRGGGFTLSGEVEVSANLLRTESPVSS